MNNDYQDLQEKLKQKAIENASLQGINYSEPSKAPAWISYISWGIGILWGIIIFIGFSQEEFTKEQPAKLLIFAIFWTLIAKLIVYWILIIIFSGYKAAKKGATIVTAKIATAVEKEHQKSRLEQEKKFLRERINDLELQNLQNRVAELEKEIHNKNKKEL